jgi:type IV secretory pathway VirD2 relaxase
MTRDDDFKPKLGKPRSSGGKHGRKYLHRVLQSVGLAGGRASSGSTAKRRGFSGARIGRGASLGRVLASRDQYAGLRGRRVVVKTRLVKLGGKGITAAKAHLRYIQRDGVTREGAPGELYSAGQDRADAKAFIERAEGDRHQFRFIVAAEDGTEYTDLKPLTRRLMDQMEHDLGTKLDWVAADHFNTGHPHSHIILRGKDERGRDLIIARDYISRGIRERATELVTLDLGPRTDLEIEIRLRQEVEQERLTSIDRALIRDMDENGLVQASARDPLQQSMRAGRLRKLERFGLATELERGHWRLTDGMAETLQRMGERGDIIKTMHRELPGTAIERGSADWSIYDPSTSTENPVIGRLVKRGLADEQADRHYLIIDGVDGRVHYVDVGKGETLEPTPENAILQITPRQTEPRSADRTIAEVAAANGGRYGVEIHLRHDPRATTAFAESHVRRLEAMRRFDNSVQRQTDGTWTIAADHLERATAYERSIARNSPVVVQMLSSTHLENLVGAEGATWLDKQLVAENPVGLGSVGFGKEVRDAQSLRRQWLVEQDLASEEGARIVYRSNLLAVLQRRELGKVGAQLSGEFGLPFVEPAQGERIEGVYRKAVDLISGRFALVERSRDFTLVPWRSVLERNLGRAVSGIAKGNEVSWKIERQRSGPSIS